MLPLRLSTQNYAWGVPSAVPSKVLTLARANRVEGTSDPGPDTPFSELWVGTHPDGGSVIPAKTPAAAAQGTLSLEEWLEVHPEALGRVLAMRQAMHQPTGRLPFLMKVLSINKALPLQAHPTTKDAADMHQSRPDLYPDASHKPEMVVSLSAFCGFAGFLGPDKLVALLQAWPQLTEVLGANNVLEYMQAAQQGSDKQRHLALAAMWDHLLLRTPSSIAAQVCSTLLALMEQQLSAPQHPPGQAPPPTTQPTGTTSTSAHHEGSLEAQQAATAASLSGPANVAKSCELALAVSMLGSRPGDASQRFAMLSAAARAWPDDPVGVLGLMLLEEVVLGPGEAVIIPAGCPHAYVCGEVLEVQAASNNTIKGGLTAHGEPTDRHSLVHAATDGILTKASQSNTPALAAGLSIPAAAAAATLPDDADSVANIHEGPACQIKPHILSRPGLTASEVGPDDLRLYQPDVDEFQVMHCSVHAGHKTELVMDPGPAVLLVVGGSGRAMVRAAAVADVLALDETELSPGAALFLSAGTSLSISGSSSAAALDIWITTANSRMFTAAPAPAGEAEAAGVQQNTSALSQLAEALVTPDSAGKAGAAMMGGAVDPGDTFTAAEQLATGIMMGAAGSSCPANAADAAAAAEAAGVGDDEAPVPMQLS